MKVLHFPDYSFANPYQELYFNALRNEGVEVIGLSEPEGHSLDKHVETEKPEILHIHWIHPYTRGRTLYKALRNSMNFLKKIKHAKKKGIKIVWTIHNLYDHESKYKYIEIFTHKRLAALVDYIFPLSNTAQKLVHKHYRSSAKKKTIVIPHGNYNGYYKNEVSKKRAQDILGLDSKKKTIVFLGMIRPYKGIENLIQAVKSTSFSGELVIAGKALNQNYLTSLQELANETPYIKFFPTFIPDDELQNFLKAADWVVFPFNNILSSGSVILAMSLACPIIVPRIGAIPEIVPPDGAIFYDNSREGLEMALNTAMEISNTSSYAIANLNAVEKLDWKMIAIKTNESYKKLTNV